MQRIKCYFNINNFLLKNNSIYHQTLFIWIQNLFKFTLYKIELGKEYIYPYQSLVLNIL